MKAMDQLRVGGQSAATYDKVSRGTSGGTLSALIDHARVGPSQVTRCQRLETSDTHKRSQVMSDVRRSQNR